MVVSLVSAFSKSGIRVQRPSRYVSSLDMYMRSLLACVQYPQYPQCAHKNGNDSQVTGVAAGIVDGDG